MISWYMLAMSDSTCYVQHLIVESVLLLSWGVLQPSFDGLPYLSPQVNLPCRMWVLMGPLQTKSKWYSLGHGLLLPRLCQHFMVVEARRLCKHGFECVGCVLKWKHVLIVK